MVGIQDVERISIGADGELGFSHKFFIAEGRNFTVDKADSAIWGETDQDSFCALIGVNIALGVKDYLSEIKVIGGQGQGFSSDQRSFPVKILEFQKGVFLLAQKDKLVCR